MIPDPVWHWIPNWNCCSTIWVSRLSWPKAAVICQKNMVRSTSTPYLCVISFSSRYSAGNYSRLTVYFRFERQIGHHLIQTFAPSTLVVMLSWFSFWLGLDAIPGRVTLLVTCMLTLVTMFTGLRADIPPVAYVKVTSVCSVILCRFPTGQIMIEHVCVRSSFAGTWSMDGRLHGVCVRRPWRICGCESAWRSIPIPNQSFTKSTANGEFNPLFRMPRIYCAARCSSHCQCTIAQ